MQEESGCEATIEKQHEEYGREATIEKRQVSCISSGHLNAGHKLMKTQKHLDPAENKSQVQKPGFILANIYFYCTKSTLKGCILATDMTLPRKQSSHWPTWRFALHAQPVSTSFTRQKT